MICGVSVSSGVEERRGRCYLFEVAFKVAFWIAREVIEDAEKTFRPREQRRQSMAIN